ncbi:type IV fimbrial biogenesis protein FimT [Acidovorax sp. 100]|uniref:GspH/FimT family pseudopilin n=1 Tax=Acidovorax sp. 100 TaxID=2135635 RepID=UPI000EF9E404|nr:GspH/FimT family pseudopilin [Acidovorax sp. 100]RMA61261.1 type IV fimbrial biogenesis protein FimT [Acidovorax sp. 100]
MKFDNFSVSQNPCHRAGGFTAIELMVVIGILAVLAGLAGPSMTLMIESWRVRDATEALRSSLQMARSEAIKRGGMVAIQKLPNNTNGCNTATSTRDWDCGWIICHDTNGNGVCNASEPVLQRIDTPSNVQVTRTGGGAAIKLNRWGLVDGAWLGFSLVPLDKSTTHPGARGVCMSSGGRIRTIPPEAIPCTS